jgi:hypothetical protein
MATTFVTISLAPPGTAVGFWISDALLELWLRLLALHLPEPDDRGEHAATRGIRNSWLLASRGLFTGCIPHSMQEACASVAGRNVARLAIDALLAALDASDAPLDHATLNLLGIENGHFSAPLERWRLRDVGYAFLDLLDGMIADTSSSSRIMPGSFPYGRATR